MRYSVFRELFSRFSRMTDAILSVAWVQISMSS